MKMPKNCLRDAGKLIGRFLLYAFEMHVKCSEDAWEMLGYAQKMLGRCLLMLRRCLGDAWEVLASC